MKALSASLELGVTRLFGNGDIGSEGLVSGWASPEDAHTWNDGSEAVMELTVQKPEQPYTLEFEGAPFVHAVCPSQEITLYCNGFRICSWKLDHPAAHTLVTNIEPEQLFLRENKAFARLAWVLPNSTRPADVKLNDDGRRLGFCFRSLTIR